MPDNAFLQIVCNSFNQDDLFPGAVDPLVCRKICSIMFENRLTNKNVLVKNIFEYGFSVQKSTERKVNIFQQI